MRRFALVVVLAALSACAEDSFRQKDVREQVLIVCEAYTSALEKTLVWRPKFTEDEWAIVQQIDRVASPECTKETPGVTSLQIVENALNRLQAELIDVALRESQK